LVRADGVGLVHHPVPAAGDHRDQNLLRATAGLLIARSGLARHESRGAHYRTDYPVHDDEHFKRHSIVQGNSIHFNGHRAAPDSVAEPKQQRSTGTAGH
jgi:succinate dehydrogenase/fumarate reductase flavoprotein subunit